MFVRKNEIISFDPQNEQEVKLRNYFYSINGWHGKKRFNPIKDNHDGTVSLFLMEGVATTISKERLPEIREVGKLIPNEWRSGLYVNINIHGRPMSLHRFLMREEIEKYEGFTEETGIAIQVNHRDENPLNNTDENLEVVTINENLLKRGLNNAKGYFKTPNGKYIVTVAKKRIGTFETKEEARQAYEQAVKEELKRLEELRINWLKEKGRL